MMEQNKYTKQSVSPAALTLILEKLERFEVCAGDENGCDIGREWFDALTTLGLLERTQRSPALWSMTPAGEALLAAQPAEPAPVDRPFKRYAALDAAMDQASKQMDRLDAYLDENSHAAAADNAAVDAFAVHMKEKLATARKKGRGGWQQCTPEDLSGMLREHVEKGDPRDVANFCMFLHALGHGIQRVDRQGVALSDALSAIPNPYKGKDDAAAHAYDCAMADAHRVVRASSLRAEVESDDERADMFWDAADPERPEDSIHNVVTEAVNNGASVGDIVEVQRAIRLDDVSVRITLDDDGIVDYEVLAAAEAPKQEVDE